MVWFQVLRGIAVYQNFLQRNNWHFPKDLKTVGVGFEEDLALYDGNMLISVLNEDLISSELFALAQDFHENSYKAIFFSCLLILFAVIIFDDPEEKLLFELVR